MTKKDETTLLDIGYVLLILKKNIISIFIWAIVGLVASLGIVFFFIEPKYSSSIDILVNQKANNAQVQYATQQADLQAINTYKDVLTKPIILTPVLKEIKNTDNYQGNLNSLAKY